MKIKRQMPVIVIILMLCLFTTTSCGENPKDTPSEHSTDSAAVEEMTEEQLVYDELEKENFNRTFTILTREVMLTQYKAENLGEGLASDIIYERNVTLAEDFGITFAYVSVNEGATDSEMKKQIAGGLDDYDMYCGNKLSFGSCAVNNYCYNLNTIASLDLSEEWWDQSCYENLTISGKTYVITGDIDPESMLYTSCLVFNKKMVSDMQKSVDQLFEIAQNGQWTLDAMYEYGQNATIDLNGDGIMKYTDDRYNLAGWAYDVPYDLFWGAGGRFVSVKDGTPELAYTPEKISDVYEKVYKIIIEQGAYYDSKNYMSSYNLFCDGRAMFLDINLSKIATHGITEMEDPYGILPTPKYDANQSEYLSFVNGYTPLAMIAKTETEPEFVGCIMEAMARYNYDRLTPNLYNVATKLQNAQDPKSAEMVDLIVRNRVFDLAYMVDWSISNLAREQLENGQIEIASVVKRQERSTISSLNRLLKSYAKHN